MYKVMLADDDYPVIELLSEEIDWQSLGFRLMGTHGNGASAWEQAQEEMPDVLITDIGMPAMDGLELTARMKERNPGLRAVILSCHDEFQYARQAMRLNVQEYFLKDALDPEDLVRLLRRLKMSMDEELQAGWEQSRLKALENETRSLRQERIIRNFIDQPLLSPDQWKREAEALGLLRDGEAVLPAVGFVNHYGQLRRRFSSEQTLRFAVGNVADEVLGGIGFSGLHVAFDARTALFLFAYRPSLKTNPYDCASASLRAVREALRSVLGVRMSFLIGGECASPESLRRQLRELLGSAEQRFYLKEGEIVKRCASASASSASSVPRVSSASSASSASSGPRASSASSALPALAVPRASSASSALPALPGTDLFSYYDLASTELREALVGKSAAETEEVAGRWIRLIERERYAPESVKDWTLKLLLDLKLKLHSLHFIGSGYTADTLHKEIADIDSLGELRDWLVGHLQEFVRVAGQGGASGAKRADVQEACKYVSLHLSRRITLEEVADHLHLNASYFSRLFKKELGITFIEYVTRMKMERAKELLDQTQRSVGEICEMLGYDNQSYFIKTFKAHAGMTPAEYRG